MKLTFVGAAHEVTGSCHFVEACGKNFLVDYGMEQGTNLYENVELPVKASDLDFVLLTHAHIDHSGMIPLLYKQGFKGQIYATDATCDLCGIMLRDSAHIQESEAEWKNRKARRAGRPIEEPIYTVDDADGALSLFVPVSYNKKIEISEGINVRFTDVGHLLGSAAIEVWLTEGDVSKKIVFSGDVGNTEQPIIKNPESVDEADYLLIESTYGNRNHDTVPDYVTEFAGIIQETFDRGGNLVIPSFAVGRTQEVLYFIREVKEKHLVKGHDNFEVYVDSPLAVESTTIYDRHDADCFDDEARALINKGVRPFVFDDLKTAVSSDESKLINFDTKPKIIISASGMCEAGRIRHHLKHNLWRSDCTILFVGYQSVGTLGRKLIEGAGEVKLFGETIDVKARIKSLKGVSGHADMKGLLDWVDAFKVKPSMIFTVHGEDTVTDDFAGLLTDTFGIKAIAPYSGGCFDLATGEMISLGIPVPVVKKKAKTAAGIKAANIFQRLVFAGRRLMDVINSYEDGANKDLEAFETQINNLINKWKK